MSNFPTNEDRDAFYESQDEYRQSLSDIRRDEQGGEAVPVDRVEEWIAAAFERFADNGDEMPF